MITLLKLFGGPGSLRLLALLCAAGLLLRLMCPQRRLLVAAWFTGVFTTYLVLAIPVTAIALEGLLRDPARRELSGTLARLDAMIVLDGDNRRGRLASALSIWHEDSPTTIFVSGEAWIADQLLAADVPPTRLQRETRATTTREQIAWACRLYESGHERVVIVASRLQARRVRGLIRRCGGRSTVYAAPLDVEPARSGVRQLVPSYAALRLSRDALYEYVALRYYQARGWIDLPAGAAEAGAEQSQFTVFERLLA